MIGMKLGDTVYYYVAPFVPLKSDSFVEETLIDRLLLLCLRNCSRHLGLIEGKAKNLTLMEFAF